MALRVHVCVYVRVCVRTCEERDKLPFQDNAISFLSPHLIYVLELILKSHVGLYFLFEEHK